MASMWEPRCRYTGAVIAAERPSNDHRDVHELLLSSAGSPP
jgi:hypothetical protein